MQKILDLGLTVYNKVWKTVFMKARECLFCIVKWLAMKKFNCFLIIFFIKISRVKNGDTVNSESFYQFIG